MNTVKKDFNKLEKAIISWFIDFYVDDVDFVNQLKLAIFKKREYTGAGFFCEIEIPRNVNAVSPKNFPISGPLIISKDIEFGGGVVIFQEDGYLDVIEIYSHGSFCKEIIENFELSENVYGPKETRKIKFNILKIFIKILVFSVLLKVLMNLLFIN